MKGIRKTISVFLGAAMCAACIFPAAACGTQGGLDEMPQYTEDKTMLIGGWDNPPATAAAYKTAADMGLNFMFMGARFAAYGSEEYRRQVATAGEQGIKSMILVGSAQGSEATGGYDWVASYKDDPNVLGVNYWDEPSYPVLQTTIQENLVWHNETFAGTDKAFYVNLYPNYVASGDLQGAYSDYLALYAQTMSRSETGDRWMSVDFYPLKLASGGSAVDTAWLGNLEQIAAARKETGAEIFHSFLLATPHYNYREISEADLRYQAWVNMAYGVNALSYFTYRRSSIESFGDSLVDMNGNPMPLYYGAQKVNAELHAIEDVYLSFDWQGMYPVTGSANEDVDGEGVSMYFRSLDHSLTELQAVSSVTAVQDTLVGEFNDKDGNYGYVVANFADPYFEEESDSSVTLAFRNANRAIVCKNGEIKTYQVTDNTLTINLDAGEGAFVVPVLLNV